jgi:polycystin 1L2
VNFFKRDKKWPENGEYKRDETVRKSSTKGGRFLPTWTLYIGWFLCILTILVSGFFIILYSMEWGAARSNGWLASIAVSVLQSVLIIDPIKVIIITALITFVLKKLDEDPDENLADSGNPLYNAIVNHDEDYLHERARDINGDETKINQILLNRKRKFDILKEGDDSELEYQRDQRKKQVQMNAVIKEGISYLSFLIVILFLVHQPKSNNNYPSFYRSMSQTFLTNSKMPFDSIITRDDLWEYIEGVLLDGLYAPPWYNGKRLVWREKLTMASRDSIRVGAARLRQLRVKENTCKVDPKFREIIKHCRDNYNWIDDDTRDYFENWQLIEPEKEEDTTLFETTTESWGNTTTTTTTTEAPKVAKKYTCRDSWCYQNTLQTKSVPISGAWTTYKGGGYVATLERSYERSVKFLADLKVLSHFFRENFFIIEFI